MQMRRRTFLKLFGVTAAGSMLPGCEREVHRLVPYLLPDDEIVPGVANWYATVCRECDAGCGTLVRVMEGRAKKIEGNPDHPLNRGKLCAQGHASLQELYNPDRLRGPMRREGARGDGRFRPIGWDEALDLWVEQLRRAPGRSAMISRPLSGTLEDVMTRFMRAIGGSLLFYEPTDALPLRLASRAVFGTAAVPAFDLAEAEYVLSFGAPFLEPWLSPVSMAAAYGDFRQGRTGVRGRFVQVEPRLSLTAANADEWVAIRPGTEGLLAVAIGALAFHRRRDALPAAERRIFEAWYGPSHEDRRLAAVARQTDVSEDVIARLADEFARARRAVALGGGSAAAHAHGTDAMSAVMALNRLAASLQGAENGARNEFGPSIARENGARHNFGSIKKALLGPKLCLAPFSAPFAAPPADRVGEASLLSLAGEIRDGRRSVIHLYDTDPVHTMPASTEFTAALQAAPFIVSFSRFIDDTTALADLIVPDHAALESWGDHIHRELIAAPAAGLAQPVVRPLYETRPIGDVLIEAARRLGAEASAQLPWPSFSAHLRERWAGEDWHTALERGGRWEETAAEKVPGTNFAAKMVPGTLSVSEPQFAGDAAEYPLYFHPFTSPALGDGRGANRPWLQEMPDPMTTAVWNSWIEINPTTARALGLRDGDIARIVSPYGSLEAPVVLYPGARPDTVSMPIGWGHRGYGRYAAGRGANPLAILAPVIDRQSGRLATDATRVRLEPAGRRGTLVRLERIEQGFDTPLIRLDRRRKDTPV
jgi:anaerobic selenocysteine-containing dehydrogenase